MNELNPNLFYVIGRKLGMTPAAVQGANYLIGHGYGEVALSVLMGVAPDGLIMQHGDACWTNERGQRVPFDPGRADWTSLVTPVTTPEMTTREWKDYRAKLGKSFAQHLAR